MFARKTSYRQGFTQLGVAVGVGVVGTLSAIAIPTYSHYADKAEASERFTMVDGLCKDVIGDDDLPPFTQDGWMDSTATFDLVSPADGSRLAKLGRWLARKKAEARELKKGKYWVINASAGALCIGAYDADGDGGYGLYYEGVNLTCSDGTPVATTLDIGVADDQVREILPKEIKDNPDDPCYIRNHLYGLRDDGSGGKTAF